VTTYIDTSTLIKLLISEPGSAEARSIWNDADALVAARILIVEARAALAAAERAGWLTSGGLGQASTDLFALIAQLGLIEVTTELIHLAGELAEEHALRGYEAVHLAGALLTEAQVFASADTVLCRAASRCGLPTANPIDRGPASGQGP